MQVTGKVLSGGVDFSTGKATLTLEINELEPFKSEYDTIKDIEKLSIDLKKYRKKRSLDANAYAWVLMSKIGQCLKPSVSKEEVYEIMLKRYGTFLEDENGNHVIVTLAKNINPKLLGVHTQRVGENEKFISYMVIKGSSEYNTAEMAKFIDGIVSEAKDLGIDTITPRELAEMKDRWHI